VVQVSDVASVLAVDTSALFTPNSEATRAAV
jgi:hypothetical protein